MKLKPRSGFSTVLASVLVLLGSAGLVLAAVDDTAARAPATEQPAAAQAAAAQATTDQPVTAQAATGQAPAEQSATASPPAAPPATPPPATPPPAPRLTAVRAAVAREAITLTLEVSGEFTYLSSSPGERLIFVDLPGAISTQPSRSRILASGLISSYRVVSYTRDGQPNARLEVLLKKPATVSAQQKPGALQVKFVPAAAPSRTQLAATAEVDAAPGATEGRSEERRVGKECRL